MIASISFDWTNYEDLAPGSDNWPLAWCEDDHQYTSWGDGGGFGGTNTEGRVPLGFGRVDGDYASFSAFNIWGGKDPVVPAEFGGKITSMWCMNGKLYGWLSPGSSELAFAWKKLIVSDDKSITWNEEAFPESRVDGANGGPGLPYTLNYGQNYSENSDGYVYTYWIQIEDITQWEVQVPGVLWLTRAPAANEAFGDQANWEWFTGLSGSTPTWSSNASSRQPVLVDTEGMMRGNALYVPALDRYLMFTNHTERNSGAIAIWEAPKPWGPWTTVLREYDWPSGEPSAPVPPDVTFGVFSPKWFSPDGLSGVFVFFRPDNWNSVPFTLPEPSRLPALAAGVALLARLAQGRTRAPSNRSGPSAD